MSNQLTTKKARAVRVILASHGYVWVPGKISNDGVGTDASGYKVAFDLSTGEWMHYRGKSDPSAEGEGLNSLAAFLLERRIDGKEGRQ